MEWYKKLKKKLSAFKVDFEKAHDLVSWRYLDFLLQILGFSPKWQSWITMCLHNSPASILINGSPTNEFEIQRGLRHGDSKSPFLFLIVMEGLHLMIRDFLANGSIHGANVGCPAIDLSHPFYADDTMFTSLFVFYLFGISYRAEYEPYLQLETVDSIDRFRKRLARWRANMLSIGGRLTLIKAVLGSLGIYYLSIFKCLETIFNDLESIRSSFFWGSTDNNKKMHWVSWNHFLSSFEKGGLNIGSLGLLIKLFYAYGCGA
ncbi:uncharacterized protein [Rutidosis leptorrhynchoides]|uniref:uncharacterized protein n=1 Tax=Rutidosis leptorrhynchoides TaxID=125765 RepID=UPI003A9A6630